jgi:hypothetical protein
MDVRMPDGTIIANVPDGTTKADLVKKLHANGMPVPADWLGDVPKPEARDDQRLLSSVPMRFAKGMKDPIDGAAQLLPKGLAAVTSGFGMAPNPVSRFFDSEAERVSADIKDSEKEYTAARAATGQQGADVARFVGNVLSPANAALTRVLPAPAVAAPAMTLARQGATAGAAGAAIQPVTGDNFWGEKALQTGSGAAAGGVMAPLLARAAESTARFIRERARTGTIPAPEVIQNEIRASFARDDIDVGQIPRQVMDQLTRQAQEAMATGRQVDAPALLRRMDFERLGMQPLLGQITRDPTQFARERDLRGIQGVGEPIANRLNQQAGQLTARLRRGAAGAETRYDAGHSLISQLQQRDEAMSDNVRNAYSAFRESTGRELPVPLDAMRAGYRETLRDFGETIPSAVRRQFEEILSPPRAPHAHGRPAAPPPPPLQILGPEGQVLSDLTPQPAPRTLSIEQAERLIKVINRNYNPADRAQALALDDLRGAVQRSIIGATETGEGMESAALANFARDAARQRFQTIDNTPALRAAVNDAAPDDFVERYVLRGKVRDLNRMADLVGPEGRRTMAQQMMAYLQQKAFGSNAAGDGSSRQARFNDELQKIGRNKLLAILGPEQTDELYTVGRVMAYIQEEPAGSAVNRSNTGAAVANLFSKISGRLAGTPYINDFVVKPVQSFRERGEVQNALAAALREQPTALEPEAVNAMTRLLRPAPVAGGAALGYSVR